MNRMRQILLSLVSTVAIANGFVLHAADSKPAKPQEAQAPATAFSDISAEQFDKLRKSEKTVVLDVRTPEEYKEGHIPGAVLIDFTSDDFAKEVAKLDKDKTYLVYCASGGRSARSCKKMAQLNFKSLYNLPGGIGAWEKAGKAVEK